MTQTVLETVGATDTTVDEDFDISVERFHEMIGDMNECSVIN